MLETLQGTRKLQRTLERLASTGSKRVARAGISGMAQPLKSSLRRTINGLPISARLKRAARLTIGSTVKRSGSSYELKVGLGVGKQSKSRKEKASARADAGGGVGISATNIHWPTLGTRERKHKSGKSTGRMPASLQGALPIAISAGSRAALVRAAQNARIALAKEAARARR
jgi:hypothetical protein